MINRNSAKPACFVITMLLMLTFSLAQAADQAAQNGQNWQILSSDSKSLELVFQLPAPELKEVQGADQTWQTLEIPGAVVHGSTGEPGLPVISRLVAVPQGMSLSVEIIAASSTTLDNLQIFPVQDPSGEEFSFSATAYQKTKAPAASPEIKVGRPAILAGQTVVPLTVNPVDYDPARKQAVVWTETRLKLSFIPDPQAATARTSNRPLPQSFVTQMESEILGFQANNLKSANITVSPLGTYLAIHEGSSSIINGIEPLLNWRRLQGYHVVDLNISLFGGDTVAIKNAIQGVYDNQNIPPLEFITIFGDVGGDYMVPSWYEELSGYHGGGDHYYTTLDGDDILADAHIGRVSFNNETEMNVVISKIVGYEKTPPMDDTDWYGRACLQGDPSASGITTIYTNQWLKGQLLFNGWSQVDTTWSGNFVNPMMSQVGAGVSAYGYRGYLGTSGISNGHVTSLNNGGKLAIALLPTCDSGSFASATTCRSEAWLRAPNGGAVAAIGTATTGTHTRYNNCYYLGAWDGLLNRGDHRIGVAHTLGKMALYSGYYLAEPDRAEIWAVWNNVMGDPATEMWTGVPGTLDVDYPSQISLGAQALTISVSHEGMPVAGARVCLFQAAQFQLEDHQLTALTDENGQVVFNIPALDNGAASVTVTKHDHLPHLGNLTVGQVDVFCAATGQSIDDGTLNPGKTVNITPRLTNHGTTDAFGVSAEVTVQSGAASVTTGSLSFGTIAAGSEVASTGPTTINIDPEAEDGSTISLLLTATNGSQTWASILEETVQAASFSVASMDLSDFGGSLDKGESGRFDLTLENAGSLDATMVSAILTTDSPWIIITDETSQFGNISTGGSGRDLLSPFQMSISTDCYGGHLANFALTITYSDGMLATAHCAAVVGTASSTEPSGPDNYGYYAYDNTDAASQMAPEYNWVGIDPDHGGQGTDLGLTDFGWEQDDTDTITLPFAFGFYGTDYYKLSICSNGWVAMGETPVNFYRNFPLPASHSAGALIAPFWDNLYQSGNHKVYTWYDEAGHRFIIQWYGMNNTYTHSPQNFELILLDPAHHPTATGDGMILFQYETVNNTDNRDGYATVGIQNMERSDGLNYSYWNHYAAGASVLTSGRAILFAPMGQVALPAVAITPESLNESVMPDQQITEYLHISNNGEDGSVLNFSIAKVDPATRMGGKTADGGDEPLAEPRNLNGSEVNSSTELYLAGSTVNLPLNVMCDSPDDEWLLKVEFDVPEGVTINSAIDFATPNGPITWNEETGPGAMTSWGSIGVGSGGFLSGGQSGNATVNLTFDPDLTGDVHLTWTVSGDNWGDPPHQITGNIILAPLSPNIVVSQPTVGDIATLGDELAVEFVAANGPEMVNIDLQREAGGPWQNLAFAWPADSSPWNWTVSGEPGPYALIRIVDTEDASVFGLSGVFAVGRNLDWLQPEILAGEVDAGQTLDLAVTMDAAGLSDGLHEGILVISSNGGAAQMVPVSLTVSGATPVAELPTAVALLGNHPNPFNPQTTISFSLPTNQDVTLRIYSARGRLVHSLLSGPQQAGLHHAVWDGHDDQGRGVASGVYFYRLVTGNESLTGKMVLAK